LHETDLEILMNRTLAALFLLPLLGLAAPAAAAEPAAKHPITHEDVWMMKRPGTPVPSPDGHWVAFSLAEPAYDEDRKTSDLWLVPVDGSAPPRRLTATRAGESDLAWRPDSTGLAFVAKREDDEAKQVYLLDVRGGGEAQRVTSLAAGADRPVWRPDGSALLVNTLVYPGVAGEDDNRKAIADRKDRKYNARAFDEFPVRHWDRWLDDRRPMLVVQSLAPGAEPRYLLAGSKLFAARGFGGNLSNEGDSIAAAWTPDGTAVVFTATDNRHEAARAEVLVSLWQVGADGGEPRRLTGPEGSYSDPEFAPDGSRLYAKFTADTEYVYNLTRLVAFGWPGPDGPAVLTSSFDRSVDDYGISADGRTAYLLAEDSGAHRLFSIGLPSGAVREVGRLEAGSLSALRVAGGAESVITAKWESAVSPQEIGRVDPASGQWSALTSFNAERVAAIDWQPVQQFWFTSGRGRRIHNVLTLPPGFDPARKYPLLVLIHGGPHGAMGDKFIIRWNYHLLGEPGYVVLATNYSGSTGFGEDFARAIQGDPLAGPAREINEAADEAIKRFPFIDGSRQAAGGASYGGHLTNWLAVSTTRYKALVSHAGLYDLKTQWTTSDVAFNRERNLAGPAWDGHLRVWRDQSPFYRSTSLKSPILVTFGEKDFRVPLNNGLEFWMTLKRQDVPSRLVVFPDENHWIMKGENSRYFYSEVHDWLGRYLQ
jgi:dipeptidyl aminopeptidase/acylaminoacyl peptidase